MSSVPGNQNVDILVMGAGPSGCLAAIGALNSNPDLNVLIIDKDQGPRHRIGEILITQTMIELDRYGLIDALSKRAKANGWGRKFGFAFVHGADRTPWVVANNNPFSVETDRYFPKQLTTDDGYWYTMMVPRHEFDLFLREEAIKRGAKFIAATAKKLKSVNSGADTHIISITAEILDEDKSPKEITIRADQFVDATGQSAFMARKVADRRPLQIKPLSARYTYFTDINYDKAVAAGFYQEGANIISYSTGWCWTAFLKPGLVSVGVVSDNFENGFFDRLMELPEADIFEFDRNKIVDFQGNPKDADFHYRHPDYSYETTVPFGRNWISVGDAARFLDPLLSQGVTLAVTFGGLIGKTIAQKLSGEIDTDLPEVYETIHRAYKAEIAILEHVIGLWYRPEAERCPHEWIAAASEVRHIVGREIKEDIQSFRWIANLENLHVLIDGGKESDIPDKITKLKRTLETEKVHHN